MRTVNLLLASLFSLFLFACGSAEKKVVKTIEEPTYNVEELLQMASSAKTAQRFSLLLQASALLIEENNIEKALEILTFVDINQLNELDRDRYYLNYGDILSHSDDKESKGSSLTQYLKIKKPSKHTIEWQVRYGKSISEGYLFNNNYYEAAKHRIDLYDLIDDPVALEANNNKIWQALAQMEMPIIKALSTGFNSHRVKGWLEVVYLNKRWGSQPDELVQQLEQWKKRFPLHPAQITKPKSLQLVTKSEPFSPRRIAILLPLSGRFAASGQMIQNGLIAAQYQSPSSEKNASLHFYDTAKSLSGLTSYRQAINEGADFIIGPLDKKGINEILAGDVELVPTLFLNRAKTQNTFLENPPNIYQFGLPVEDEAVQAAHRAFEKGYRKALAFVKDDPLGQRAKAAFKDYFEQLGGELIDTEEYKDIKNLNSNVQSLLRVGDSIKRKTQLEKTLGRNIEYTMRRRQDADVVFLFSNAKNARRIKPFINFYFALDLPVVSTSRIYSGSQEDIVENDLNGIEFSDIPMYLSQQPDMISLREELSSLDKNILKQNNGRLFSLGYDAYQVLTQLPVLKAFPSYHWFGLSGELGVDENGIVHRYLTWAKFAKGKPKVTKERLKTDINESIQMNRDAELGQL